MPLNTIPLVGCTSSRIHSHGYDAATKTLALRFANKGKPGPVYQYANFTPEQYAELTSAESMGRWFALNLSGRGQDHPFTKMDAEPEEKPAKEPQT